ncbi:hypothetical protein N2152v2_003689 [Parachlorella kessleri]
MAEVASAPAPTPPSSGSSKDKEVPFDINDAAFSSDTFRIYEFKASKASGASPCPFAHPAEKAKRRDPRKINYSGTACPDFRKGGSCPRGDSCPFAHGVFECWLHPSRYRTQMCTDGVNCKRRVCFFAHFESELRKAEADPILLSFQLHKELGPDMRMHHYKHHQQPQFSHAFGGGILGHPYHLTSPQSAQYMGMGGLGMGGPVMPVRSSLAPVIMPGAPAHMGDGSAPCTPTAAVGLTPATSQDSATLLAQLQLLQQQQQQQQAAAGAAGQPRPSSAPLSGGASPAGSAGGEGSVHGMSRPVSASASGGTLGSCGSPPVSPTAVAAAAAAQAAAAAAAAAVAAAGDPGSGIPGTPSMSGDSLKGPLSPLGAALLQQQAQQDEAAAVADALALLQASGMAVNHLDQTSLLVALHTLALSGNALPSQGALAAQLAQAACAGAAGGGLIRHASDVYMQTRAAAAVAAALSPPGHGLVSHRRSMDNSMLAQLTSLSRTSPVPLDAQLEAADMEGFFQAAQQAQQEASCGAADGFGAADLALDAARLSPLAMPPSPRIAALSPAAAAGVQLSSSLPPASPRYLASLATAASGPSPVLVPPGSPLARAAEQQRHRSMSPAQQAQQAGLHRIVTVAAAAGAHHDAPATPGGGLSGLTQPPTPQTAPAAMVRDAWSQQLCSIAEGAPALMPSLRSEGAGLAPRPASSVYKTLSDSSVLVRNLSFENILAELPRSSSQVALAAQQHAAAAGEGGNA